MGAFQPIDGIARWRKLYAHVESLPHEYMATYEELGSLLDDPSPRVVQAAMYRAIGELEDAHGRTMVAVSGKGYRVARPNEHITLSRRHANKSRRQVAKAMSKTNVEAGHLLPHEQKMLDDHTQRIQGLELAHRQMWKRQERTEARTKRVEINLEDVQSRLARYEEILRAKGMLPQEPTAETG